MAVLKEASNPFEQQLLETVLSGLRPMIASISDEIKEQVKWNSPAFIYEGEMKPFDPKDYKRDLLVVNLHRGTILLVFPTGSKIQQSGKTSGKKLSRWTKNRPDPKTGRFL